MKFDKFKHIYMKIVKSLVVQKQVLYVQDFQGKAPGVGAGALVLLISQSVERKWENCFFNSSSPKAFGRTARGMGKKFRESKMQIPENWIIKNSSS